MGTLTCLKFGRVKATYAECEVTTGGGFVIYFSLLWDFNSHFNYILPLLLQFIHFILALARLLLVQNSTACLLTGTKNNSNFFHGLAPIHLTDLGIVARVSQVPVLYCPLSGTQVSRSIFVGRPHI